MATPAAGGARPSRGPWPSFILMPALLIKAMDQQEKETGDPHHQEGNPFLGTVSQHLSGTGEHKGITHIAGGLWPSVF